MVLGRLTLCIAQIAVMAACMLFNRKFQDGGCTTFT